MVMPLWVFVSILGSGAVFGAVSIILIWLQTIGKIRRFN